MVISLEKKNFYFNLSIMLYGGSYDIPQQNHFNLYCEWCRCAG